MRDEKTREIPEILLSQLSQALEAAVGIHFPRSKWRQLSERISAVAGALGFEDAESCVRHLVSEPLTQDEIELLAPHVTIGETYFFREPASFAALEEDVLPRLIHSRRGARRSLRIWSAGCATGEEPYSIAILLDRLIPDIADWSITILATDINPAFLQRAAAGIYGDWSFRSAPRWLKERYFRRTTNGRFEIHPRIKGMVTFSYRNLAQNGYHPNSTGAEPFDVIFCRNVLMYFAPHRAREVVRSFHSVLADGGHLVLSATEASSELSDQYSAVGYPGTTLYRKDRSPGARQMAISREVSGFGFQMSGDGPHPGDGGWEIGDGDLPHPDPLPGGEGDEKAHPEGEGGGSSTQHPTPNTRSSLITHHSSPNPDQSPPDPFEEAQALYRAGRYAEVVARLAHLLPGQPSGSTGIDGRAIALLARSHANQGQLDEALRCCEVGVAADKLNPGSHYLMATILQEHGREDEAVLSLRRALYLDQDFVLAHFALANLARQRGGHQEAIRHFQIARALLERCASEEVLPESDGMTAGCLKVIIGSLLETEASL